MATTRRIPNALQRAKTKTAAPQMQGGRSHDYET